MGIADPSPQNKTEPSSLIPQNYYCHYTFDLAEKPAKIDIIRYQEEYLGFDEYIDI